jgi:hypothetical protein
MDKELKGDLNHPDLTTQIVEACYFTIDTSFNLAHWLFAFSYLTLSYRLELSAKELPVCTHDCRLNTLNVVVCLFNMAVPAVNWIYFTKEKYKASYIAYDIE